MTGGVSGGEGGKYFYVVQTLSNKADQQGLVPTVITEKKHREGVKASDSLAEFQKTAKLYAAVFDRAKERAPEKRENISKAIQELDAAANYINQRVVTKLETRECSGGVVGKFFFRVFCAFQRIFNPFSELFKIDSAVKAIHKISSQVNKT